MASPQVIMSNEQYESLKQAQQAQPQQATEIKSMKVMSSPGQQVFQRTLQPSQYYFGGQQLALPMKQVMLPIKPKPSPGMIIIQQA